MNILQKYKNWKKNPNRAPVSIPNIWAVLQSLFRRNIHTPKHIEEQVEWRRKVSNPKCIENDECICSCTWSELIYADKACDGKCYPPMMPRVYWKKYKDFIHDKG